MNKPSLIVENLGKKYKIGPRSIRFSDIFRNQNYLSKSQKTDPFWALKGISFELREGEILGIIGHNGAGKSTLLKLLSRITSPSTGKATVWGKVASLLEVGTGFHPELTGRENIYLNGAILGMTSREIQAAEEQIIDFSGIERFIEMPVKNYSSGMYVRLAFAVAAHLEADILLIDEVLAVGDANFRRKCIERMKNVTNEGKTVLFASHNMASILQLCQKGIYLNKGSNQAYGNIIDVVKIYTDEQQFNSLIPLLERNDRQGNGKVFITKIELNALSHTTTSLPAAGLPLEIFLEYQTVPKSHIEYMVITLEFTDEFGNVLFICNNKITASIFNNVKTKGRLVCRIPKLPLNKGNYFINYYLLEQQTICDHLNAAISFEIDGGDFYGSGILPSPKKGLLVSHSWSIE